MKTLILILALAAPTLPQTYTATAYCLRGRTASGEMVRQGIIASDPKVLPMGSTVSIRGMGQYVVKDTGGLIKGYRIDIWMASCRDARQFGRRKVQLTVDSKPVRRKK